MNVNVRKIFAERPLIKGHYIDVSLLVSIILLWGLGLLLLYICSAEYAASAFGSAHYFINRQLVMSGAGVLVIIITIFLPQQFIRKCLPLIMAVTFIFCLLPFVPGIAAPRNGAKRWISLPFFGESF